MDRGTAAARIQQIEALQDEILAQLADLERRTEAALADFAPISKDPNGPAESFVACIGAVASRREA
jgi:hypothetical protein